MYLVSGSNLFGQWLLEDPIVTGFKDITLNAKVNLKGDPAQVKLLHINWSYNIFSITSDFYLCGSWHGKENQCIKLDLPPDCKSLPWTSLIVVGNDYNLILVDKNTYTIWFVSLEKENCTKKLSLKVDAPIARKVDTKKVRVDDKITKIVATNTSCLYLTTEGNVYCGLVPSHLDTSHCTGKVIDIACGYEHFMLLTDQGRIYTWGNGRRLQLGHGEINNLDSPTGVEALAGLKMVKISAGGWHSLAVSEFGDLYAWGWNDIGQLGIKSLPDNTQGVLKTEGLKSYHVPTIVDLYDDNEQEINLNVKAVACGSRHSAIVLEDNSVWTSGCNKYGQLGVPPEQRATFSHFKKSFISPKKSLIKCGPWSTTIRKF